MSAALLLIRSPLTTHQEVSLNSRLPINEDFIDENFFVDSFEGADSGVEDEEIDIRQLNERVTRLENSLTPNSLMTFIRIMEAIPPYTVYFRNNSSVVPRSHYSVIDRIGTALLQYPAAHVFITGHSDGYSSRRKTIEIIASERALAVARCLCRRFSEDEEGINRLGEAQEAFIDRISAIGRGASEPVAVIPESITKDAICALHRRAVITLDRERTLRALQL